MNDKIVISQFTDLDKNLEALAETSAECRFRIYAGYCKSCEGCKMKQVLDECEASLPVGSWLRVNRMSDRMYVGLALRYRIEKDRQRRTRRGLKLLAALFVVVAVVCMKWALFPESYDDYVVRRVLALAHPQVRDVNGDGVINCVDYAVCFKKQWDELYVPDYCEIVRNVNKTPGSDFNHLFVRCWVNGRWLYVEPQAKVDGPYDMYEVWYREYNRKYGHNKTEARKYGYNMFWNVYGETDKWMSSAKTQGKRMKIVRGEATMGFLLAFIFGFLLARGVFDHD